MQFISTFLGTKFVASKEHLKTSYRWKVPALCMVTLPAGAWSGLGLLLQGNPLTMVGASIWGNGTSQTFTGSALSPEVTKMWKGRSHPRGGLGVGGPEDVAKGKGYHGLIAGDRECPSLLGTPR